MALYGYDIYSITTYGPPSVITSFFEFPRRLGVDFGNTKSNYNSTENNFSILLDYLADENIYPKPLEDEFLVTQLEPNSITITGKTAPNADVNIYVNGYGQNPVSYKEYRDIDNGGETILLGYKPREYIQEVLTRGATSIDRLIDKIAGDTILEKKDSILRIGDTSSSSNYVYSTDWTIDLGTGTFDPDGIDWTPAGSEPALNQKYYITYRSFEVRNASTNFLFKQVFGIPGPNEYLVSYDSAQVTINVSGDTRVEISYYVNNIIAGPDGTFQADVVLSEGRNTITGHYSYIEGSSPFSGDFVPLILNNNNIWLILYEMGKELKIISDELEQTKRDAFLTDNPSFMVRDTRLDEIWGTRFQFPYDSRFGYDRYRQILIGLSKVLQGGSTKANILQAFKLIAGNDNVFLYEYYKEPSSFIYAVGEWFSWLKPTDPITSIWAKFSVITDFSWRWIPIAIIRTLGLTPFGIQIFFPLENYSGPVDHLETLVNLTVPKHVITAIIFYGNDDVPEPENRVSEVILV